MGDMFRSETMDLCQVFLQPEAAYATLSEFGELGCVQFMDLNEEVHSSQRKFISEVRRCEEMERKMHFIEKQLIKDDFKLPRLIENVPTALNPRNVNDLEADLEKVENELLELAINDVKLQTNYLELTEMRMMLQHAQSFFEEQEIAIQRRESHKGHGSHGDEGGQLSFVAGLMNRERIFGFERMLWRISRGNVFLRRSDLTEPLRDPKTGNQLYKSVFVAFFQGEQLKTRVKKVCTGFHANMYNCPISHVERGEMLKGILTRLADMQLVMQQTDDHRKVVLATVVKDLPAWQIMVKKMKAIYHTLNYFNIDVTEKCLIGECWVPSNDLHIVRKALSDGASAVGSTVPSFLNVVETTKNPPTYYRTNKFTRGFQALIDAYGVGRYREVNPALYTCITFPFLFAVMFGDLGHGLLMFVTALWMVLDEKRLSTWRAGEIWHILFSGRYIILLMGLFAMYTGFTYNDIFSKSLNVFGSTWRIRYNTSTVLNNTLGLTLDPKYAAYGTYPLGLDPIWQLADNQIIFTNTFKMKLSIILGIIHMTLGIFLSVVNYVYFKNYSSIILEFVPQIIFLWLLFGYMVFMMFYKWVQYSAKDAYFTPGCAPSVLIMFINMVLFNTAAPLTGCGENMYHVQPVLQTIFVIVALLCIPWMLLGKPLYIQCKRRGKDKITLRLDDEIVLEEVKASTSTIEVDVKTVEVVGEEEGEEPMSEIYIHQAIHTIEYVLSTVSHTASYLRLWALSLAHAELSQVLWNMVMRLSLKTNSYVGCIYIFLIFAVWAVLTVAIMILMEGLSAFLHTLRLHWVELMSKFYAGTGHAFMPFSFKVLLAEEEED